MKVFVALSVLAACANAGVILQSGLPAGPLTPAFGDLVATNRGLRPISLEGFSEDVNQDGFVDPIAQAAPVVHHVAAPFVHHAYAAPIAAAPIAVKVEVPEVKVEAVKPIETVAYAAPLFHHAPIVHHHAPIVHHHSSPLVHHNTLTHYSVAPIAAPIAAAPVAVKVEVPEVKVEAAPIAVAAYSAPVFAAHPYAAPAAFIAAPRLAQHALLSPVPVHAGFPLGAPIAFAAEAKPVEKAEVVEEA